jgi:hypothetical protein
VERWLSWQAPYLENRDPFKSRGGGVSAAFINYTIGQVTQPALREPGA